jgi:zinc D-Ala-D-Ala carboxypeptidase
MQRMRSQQPRRAATLALASLVLVAGLAPVMAQSALSSPMSPPPPPQVDAMLTTMLAATDAPSAAAAAPASGLVPTIVVPAARLPACEYRDDRTRYGAVRDWSKTLLDTNLRLRRKYEPWDLVSVSRAGLAGSGQVRKLIIEDLNALAAAARDAGKPLAVRSAYRSYQTQAATFQMWVDRSGYDQALKFSARPGHSEHQLGTTIDFTTAPGVPLSGTFGDSPSGKWLARNGWKYGFIMSYPEGKRRVSCYGYEPWHFRYVGRDLARQVQESGQVPRRFFWEQFESAP